MMTSVVLLLALLSYMYITCHIDVCVQKDIHISSHIIYHIIHPHGMVTPCCGPVGVVVVVVVHHKHCIHIILKHTIHVITCHYTPEVYD